MTTEREDKIYERAFQYQSEGTPLKDIIEQEDLKTWKIEYMTVVEAAQVCYAIVPYGNYMIMAHDRCNHQDYRNRIAEYAIYRQHDLDGCNLYNALNYNAEYKFIMVSDDTWENMALAISDAIDEIERLNDGIIELVSDMTDGDPMADLSDEDILNLIAEAKTKCYEYAECLTPELFREIYNELKGDD